MNKKNSIRFFIGVFFVLFIASLYYKGTFSKLNVQLLQKHADLIAFYIQNNYFFSLMLFSVLFVFAVVFFVPITVLLTIASGYFFGPLFGTIISVLCATAGGVLLFIVVRFVLHDFVQQRYKRQLTFFNSELKQYGSLYLLLLQLLPVTPIALINFFAGVSPVTLFTYVWTTVLGILPGTIIYAFAGKQLHSITEVADTLAWPWLLLLCVFALLAFLPRLFFTKK